MAFVIPDGLDETLYGLAWMVGVWQGDGHRIDGDQTIPFSQDLVISHAEGPYLHYVSQVYDVDADGKRTGTHSMESGFWRGDGKGAVEAMLVHPEGFAEMWYGKIEGAKIELVTDGVMRAKDSAVAVVGGQRLYGQVEGKLMWSYDRATEETRLAPHMWAVLERREMADGTPA